MYKVWICILLITSFSGCAVFTKPVDTITFDRQELIDTYARAKIAYWRIVEIAMKLCETGQWPPSECAKAQRLHEQAKQVISEIDSKIATPESQIDYQRVMKLFELALGILL